MATRAEIEQAVNEFADAVRASMAAHYLNDFADQYAVDREKARQARDAARARLLALLPPEPEPSEREIAAGADALEEWERTNSVSLDGLFSDDRATEQAMRAMRHAEQCQQAKAVLLAARQARQTGGAE